MSTKTIDGNGYARMLRGGAAVLSEHIEELNALNVFPVQDGDTGTNMSRTIEGGLAQASDQTDDLGAFSKSFSRGVLLSARGNSGVILSQIFAGINESLEEKDSVNASALAEAYKNGITRSYAAVQNPTEGTILTVFRESTEYAAEHLAKDAPIEEFYRLLLDEARRSLAATTQLLPVLAEADVVDSGAAGYLYIAQGMYDALTGEIAPDVPLKPAKEKAQDVNIDLFTRDSKLTFGYCTEFLLRLTTDKVDPDSFEIGTVLSVLERLKGQSVVAYKAGDIIKVHVHTFTPGLILDSMQRYGEFLTVKIENMQLGHSEEEPVRKKPTKPYSVVAVANGAGMCELFKSLGADEVISGGQSFNPSTQDFLGAFDRCEGKTILVLPNNKNIFLAAKQAAEMYERADVRIVETENLMQGYGALNLITPGISDMDALTDNLRRGAKTVQCCEVTRAVRDALVDGHDIKTGQYLAILDGRIACVADTPEDAALGMAQNADLDLSEIMTVFTGRDASEENSRTLCDRLSESCPDLEIKRLSGGQDIYDYLIAIE